MSTGAIVSSPVSEDEFNRVAQQFREDLEQFRKKCLEYASFFARLSTVQIERWKKQFHKFLDQDWLERIIMHGRGLISAQHAAKEKWIRGSYLKRLEPETLKVLNNSSAVVEVATARGNVLRRTVEELNPLQIAQIAKPGIKGILPAHKQITIPTPAETKRARGKMVSVGHAEPFKRIIVQPNSNSVIIVGANERGEDSNLVEVPLDTLRRLLK